MGRLLSSSAARLGVLLISLGTRSGLWSALAGAGPLTSADVAAKVAVDRALVREWLRAQAAGGYLEYDSETRHVHVARRPSRRPSSTARAAPLVEACVYDGAGRWPRASTTSARPSAADRASGGTSAPRSIGTAPTRSPGSALPVELVGCGDRAARRRAARYFGRGRHRAGRRLRLRHSDAGDRRAAPGGAACSASTTTTPRSCMPATAAAEAAAGQVRFEVAAANDLPDAPDAAPAAIDLITFFDSLHDIGDARGALARRPERLSPHGAVLLFEPLGADSVAGTTSTRADGCSTPISTLACTPNAVSQRTATSSEPLGAQAGEQRAARVRGRGRVRHGASPRRAGAVQPGLGAAPLNRASCRHGSLRAARRPGARARPSWTRPSTRRGREPGGSC